MEKDSACKVFEDQQDYVEDIYEQLRDGIRRYALYGKMFAYPEHWKFLKAEVKRVLNYEVEKAFSKLVIKETKDGIIMMKFDEKDQNV